MLHVSNMIQAEKKLTIQFLSKVTWAYCQISKIAGAHAPGMPGTFFTPPRVGDPDMHHGTCVTHVPWCMLGSLTSGFLWSKWRGKRSWHSGRMRKSQFYVSPFAMWGRVEWMGECINGCWWECRWMITWASEYFVINSKIEWIILMWENDICTEQDMLLNITH